MARKSYWLLVSAAVLALDQWSKAVVDQALRLHESRPVIPGFFNLVHTRNTGAVFGFFQDSASDILPHLLTALSLAALTFVIAFFAKSPVEERMNLAGLSLILGGALGNIIDRLIQGAVIDFLEFYVGSYHWPAFNVADASICVGIGLLLIRSFREERAPAGGHRAAVQERL